MRLVERFAAIAERRHRESARSRSYSRWPPPGSSRVALRTLREGWGATTLWTTSAMYEGPVRGQLGSAAIAFLTITPDEFDSAKRVLETSQRLHQMYFVNQISADNNYGWVLRQAADRTNVPAARAT